MQRTLILIPLLSGLLLSCKKEKEYQGTASLTIVNAVVGSEPLLSNFMESGHINYFFKKFQAFYYNSFNESLNMHNAYSGNQSIRIFQYPDTTDEDGPLFDMRLDLPVASVNSLYLTGTVASPDTVFIRESIPAFEFTDSIMRLRFINLSPGSAPISINVKGQNNGSVAASLPFKGMTGFIHFSVGTNVNDYEFEFRDAITGNLITTLVTSFINNPGTVVPNSWIFKNFTVAFTGKPGGTGAEAQNTLLIQHFRKY